MASRLADLAIPREILVDEATVNAAGDGEFVFRPAGRRMLKGFDQPSEVFSLSIDEVSATSPTSDRSGP